MADPCCGSCKFYSYTNECRRYAPRPVIISTDDSTLDRHLVFWPDTDPSDFCGEFVRGKTDG